VGVARAGLVRAILSEALMVGVPGTLLGLLLGALLGSGLTGLVVQTIDDLYFRLRVDALALSGWPFAKAVRSGSAPRCWRRWGPRWRPPASRRAPCCRVPRWSGARAAACPGCWLPAQQPCCWLCCCWPPGAIRWWCPSPGCSWCFSPAPVPRRRPPPA
jgi:hypothetical protein